VLTTGAIVLALALGAAACGDDSSSGSTSGSPAPTVANAWARTSAASQTTGAAYMDITGGSSADKLVSAAAPTGVSAKTEIHETTMAQSSGMAGSGMTGSGMTGSGMMEMKPVSSISIPAGKTVKLEPGGYHVMLVDLAKPLTVGQKFTLTLTFEKAGKVEVPVEVRAS
jgi:copper(I)-binding protein